jgi:hypothetical protein
VFILKRLLHDLAVALAGFFMKMLPDKIPVTFVGAEAARELCESIAHICSDKVLIVTDATLVEIGLIDRITDSLDAVGLRWSVYSGVEPDPTFAQVEAGFALLEREGCKAILAVVVGGSSMDASKLIAAMATNPEPLRKLEGMMKIKLAPMPLSAIPTTAGTGSKVTLVAVISDPETHAKKFFTDPKLMPLMTTLDPSLMTGLPAPITAATGMDALTHAVESFLSRMSTETTEIYAKISVLLVFDHLHTAYTGGNNLEARKAMALASYLRRARIHPHEHRIRSCHRPYLRRLLANASRPRQRHCAAACVGVFKGIGGEPTGTAGRGDRMRGYLRSGKGGAVHRCRERLDGQDRHPAQARRAGRDGYQTHCQTGARRGPSQLSSAAIYEPGAVRESSETDDPVIRSYPAAERRHQSVR